MNTTLDYASPEAKTPPRFWPALVVAITGCPAASVATAVLGAQLALGSGRIPPGDFPGVVFFGLVAGVLGGLVAAAFARAWRPQAMAVSIVASLIVSGGIGVCLFLLASMAPRA
jgi:hypothetical protein